jgi:hypothetical protein
MARHFESMGQPRGAVQYEMIAVDCRGLWSSKGGEAALWLADYFLAQGDKARGVNYLNDVVTKYPGLWDGNKKKAIQKLTSLGMPIPATPPKGN